ncbi:hydrogenase accessory protein HypB [Bradyrhizobium macuxiense]|uniref:Hydrogenase accessory protein HypB n=1 Tax=Bradyrhizobium macuxiense TaxID=1755647 RepID=A0A109JZX9_9BRAD|nr:hydrogenase expression/formation protein [Bradyrhizobium macuxiense]KWV58128.1 hydrogenase accessory protein HypB [Bradyrhizobium macuxiense]
MKTGFPSAQRAERPLSVFPAGAESLDAGHRGRTAATALAKLASLDGVELARNCPNAVALLSDVAAAVARQKSGAQTQLFKLAALGDLERKLIADVLGTGEIAGVVALPDGSVAQIEESVLAGIWRVCIGDDPSHEYIEIGAIPQIVRRAATDLTSTDLAIKAAPEGAMNVLPVLAEIRDRALAWRPGMRAHIINFTLLPMSPVDQAFLQQSVGNGPIRLTSRGYGTCRVQATGIRNIWSVQFFNSMDNIIMDTLEVGGVPTVALAADEDFEDSGERMQEIIEAYFK